MKKIKVLVVDASLLFQDLLVKVLSEDPTVQVVAAVTDPFQARDAILEYHPDVMTLDSELPRMNGIEFLRRLMPQYPIASVVISSMANLKNEAMNAGAVAFISKPTDLNSTTLQNFIRKELITKIKIASTVKVGGYQQPEQIQELNNMYCKKHYEGRIIAIGASTGGTEAILEVVKGFDIDIPGVVIVQHMPPGFTKMYAERLNNSCRVAVKEAKTGDRVLAGQVLVAPGDSHMRLTKINEVYHVECKPGEKTSGHCPSVDVLFDSVARCAGKAAVGIILTGMGSDGAQGLLNMRRVGCVTIGQDEGSCIVYGMPKVAYDIGAVCEQVSLTNISGQIYNILNRT